MNVAHVVFQIQESPDGEIMINLSHSGSTDLQNPDAISLFNRAIEILEHEMRQKEKQLSKDN